MLIVDFIELSTHTVTFQSVFATIQCSRNRHH